MTSIVLIAMVAAFLALTLFRVLGKRTGHEQSFPTQAEERAPVVQTQPGRADAAGEAAALNDNVVEPAAAAGIRAIGQAEPNFDVGGFVEGAKSAYRMILEAYWKGDEQALAKLVDDDVRAGFSEAIAMRRKAGETLDNRLVTIERAIVSGAEVTGGEARVTVRFDADIAAVTRDAEGNVVAGSLTDAVPTHDVWTFARKLRAGDPNWTLVETDEAS